MKHFYVQYHMSGTTYYILATYLYQYWVWKNRSAHFVVHDELQRQHPLLELALVRDFVTR